MSDGDVALAVTKQNLDTTYAATPFVATTLASGSTAADVSQEADNLGHGTEKQETRMRRLLRNDGHIRNLGQLTAVDLFLGNADRVFQGNLGNWFYDPARATITAIDHRR